MKKQLVIDNKCPKNMFNRKPTSLYNKSDENVKDNWQKGGLNCTQTKQRTEYDV